MSDLSTGPDDDIANGILQQVMLSEIKDYFDQPISMQTHSYFSPILLGEKSCVEFTGNDADVNEATVLCRREDVFGYVAIDCVQKLDDEEKVWFVVARARDRCLLAYVTDIGQGPTVFPLDQKDRAYRENSYNSPWYNLFSVPSILH